MVLILVDLLTFVKTDKSLKLILLNSVFLGLYSSLRQSKTNLIELKLSLKSSLKSLKKRDLGSKLVRRRGRVYIINKKNPKFKARQK